MPDLLPMFVLVVVAVVVVAVFVVWVGGAGSLSGYLVFGRAVLSLGL